MGRNAPPIHSVCMRYAEGSHLSVMRITINSGATRASPKVTGNDTMHVKRSIFENALHSRSLSSPISTKAGCATPCTMPVMTEAPMVFHLFA